MGYEPTLPSLFANFCWWHFKGSHTTVFVHLTVSELEQLGKNFASLKMLPLAVLPENRKWSSKVIFDKNEDTSVQAVQ